MNHRPTVPAPHRAQPKTSSTQYVSVDDFLYDVRQAYTPGADFPQRLSSAGVNTSVPSEGGYALPTPLLDDLINWNVETWPVLAGVTQKVVKMGYLYEGVLKDEGASLEDGTRNGGIEMPIVREGERFPYSSPKLRQVRLELQARGTIVPITNKVLRNSTTIEDSVSGLVGEELNSTIANHVWNGLGAGEQLGVCRSGALITVPIEVGQSIANTPTHITANVGKMSAQSRRYWRSAWYAHPELFTALITGTWGGASASLLTPPDAGAPFGRLALRPIYPNEVAPPVGTVGDFVLADMSDYVLATTGPMQRAVSIHARFEHAESLYRFTVYLDGQPATSAPIMPFTGILPKSPYVALGARS